MKKNLLNAIELFLIAKVCMPKPSINQPPYNLFAQAIFLTQTQPFLEASEVLCSSSLLHLKIPIKLHMYDSGLRPPMENLITHWQQFQPRVLTNELNNGD